MSQKENHNFNKKSKWLPWPWCSHCGLVKLRNSETEKAIKLGCDWQELQNKK